MRRDEEWDGTLLLMKVRVGLVSCCYEIKRFFFFFAKFSCLMVAKKEHLHSFRYVDDWQWIKWISNKEEATNKTKCVKFCRSSYKLQHKLPIWLKYYKQHNSSNLQNMTINMGGKCEEFCLNSLFQVFYSHFFPRSTVYILISNLSSNNDTCLCFSNIQRIQVQSFHLIRTTKTRWRDRI